VTLKAVSEGGEITQPTRAPSESPGCSSPRAPSFQKGDTYYFCSAGCKERFDKDPAKYIREAKK